ncbi:MAG: hypothetical protein K2X03_22465 [Bryobacteraceae bacterium]|nr:hypothetical protein [Bryobacteraceae bacterium]
MAKGGLSKPFGTALARPVLNRLATIPIFQQGQELFLKGHVSSLEIELDETAASVSDGGESFLARLWMEDGFLQYECPCERGAQGLLCAHSVAVALAALEPKPVAAKGSAKGKPKAKKLGAAEMDKILREQPSDVLAGLLLNWAQQDDRLLQHLMNFAVQEGGYALDLKAYIAALKKRLKRPPQSARPAEWKKHGQAIQLELDQASAMTGQGQPFAALEVIAELINLLFTFDRAPASAEALLTMLPAAMDEFLRAARLAKATPQTLIPYLLKFYLHDFENRLRYESAGDRIEALRTLLGEAGVRQLSEAAEAALTSASGPRQHTIAVRMLTLAQSGYAKQSDYDSMERAQLRFDQSNVDPDNGFVFFLTQRNERERAIAYVGKLMAQCAPGTRPHLPLLMTTLLLQAGRVEDAFVAAIPVFSRPDYRETSRLQQMADQHQCWPEWRKFLFSSNPPGNPTEAQRHLWAFNVHMATRQYPAAWEVVRQGLIESPQAAECAMEMRDADPLLAATVLSQHGAGILNVTSYSFLPGRWLQAACEIVLKHKVRPANLESLLRELSDETPKKMGYMHYSSRQLWKNTLAILTARTGRGA